MEHTQIVQKKGFNGMSDLVYKNEKMLYWILAIIAALFWLLLTVGTFGMVLIYLAAIFFGYLFVQSALICYIKGTAVEINSEQLPLLYQQYLACCAKLDIKIPPRAYILAADGFLNAFATRFLNRNYVVLYSSVVDALASDKDAINFYIGHELGHIRRNHLGKAPFLALVRWLPLVGAAYSRACEYTCDLHGLRCCDNERSALNAVAVLAIGVEQWKHMNVEKYIEQARESAGFWMSLHELNGDYPWLTKRMARIHAKTYGQEYTAPNRSKIAYLLSLFIPNIGTGSIVILVIIAILFSPAMLTYRHLLNSDLGGYEEQSIERFENYKSNDSGQAACDECE